MTSTFVSIRRKIADAQDAIREHNTKAKVFEEEKLDADQRTEEARAKCADLRNKIADRERDLADVENQIPLAKSKMHELKSVFGENKHFEKVLEQTRREVEVLEKRKEQVHLEAKQKAEDCWQAKQKLHSLEVRVEEVDKKIEFCMRRMIVAQEKIAAVDMQANSISTNYRESSKSEMENTFYELQLKVSGAKERRKKSEEEALQLTWDTEELGNQIKMYHNKMREMFTGQRELASSKLL